VSKTYDSKEQFISEVLAPFGARFSASSGRGVEASAFFLPTAE
jgi:hypothetical protein